MATPEEVKHERVMYTIDALIKEIESDNRHEPNPKKVANVFSNSPLALIQMGFSSELKILKRLQEVDGEQ